MAEILGIVGNDPTGFGVLVAVPLLRARRTSQRKRQLWGHVAAHLAAGWRVRRGGAVADAGDGSDAVLTPNGRVEHAVGPARDGEARAALREAAVAIDRARGALRREDAGGAVFLWKGLVAGTWSLLDHFDRDGRRLLAARKNAADPGKPTTLSQRGRQVLAYRALGHSLKFIAYELGLSQATVSEELARAKARLGLHSDAEIPLLFRAPDDLGARGGAR